MATTWWIRSGYAACVALCVFVASCAKTREDNGTDSTTHWLQSCSDDADCGALACLCGVCTAACDDSADCSEFGDAAVCRAPRESCGAPQTSCLMQPQPTGAGSGAVGGGGGAVSEAGSGSEPAPTCTLPWYECPDVCPGQLILEGGSRSFGECVGDCSMQLRILAAIVLDVGNCQVLVELTVQNTDGSSRVHQASFTAEGWERATQISIELAAARAAIPAVSGCPDCADGGAATIAIRGLGPMSQSFSYPYSEPPQELVTADEFVQTLIDDLLACDGAWFESCTIGETTPSEPTADVCRFEYTGDPATSPMASCEFAVDAAGPCMEAARCLCAAGVLAMGATPQDIEACAMSWVLPRGAITFTDFCSQGAQTATRTFAEAIAGFAEGYGHSVTTSAGCEQASAYY